MWLITIDGQSPTLCRSATDFAAYVADLMGEVFEVQYVNIWEPPPPAPEGEPILRLKREDFRMPEPLSGDSE